MGHLTHPYRAMIMLSSERNPNLEVLVATVNMGEKWIVSQNLDHVWPAVSYRIRTTKRHRRCDLLLPKQIKNWIKTAFKGPVQTRHNLEEVFQLPVKYLEYYDTLYLTALQDGSLSPTAPPPYVGEEGREDHLRHLQSHLGSDPDGGDPGVCGLLQNAFYNLSISTAGGGDGHA
ncbi:hypothetical protein [Orinoco virus]|uniref:Uncharacterized protein n=1 Tax=Orinoco virus TaxID=1871345 RepID=A0A1B1FIU7_9MONO|nr:hypothetical protein [Orinoco virus]ANQ45642.1 hypothetical protein [Orinoco virus]